MDQEQKINLERIINRDYTNVTGIVIRSGGSAVCAKYFNGCTEASRTHVFSVTKSILSLLIGIAFGKGKRQSVNQPVSDFFPEYKLKRGEKIVNVYTE